MAKFDETVKKYCDLTIEDMNDKGLEIPEELLDLLNQLPYSVCDQHRFGPDVIATICGLGVTYKTLLWGWGMDLTQAISDAFEENKLDGDVLVGDLRKYVYFGIPADKYIGECVDLGDDPRNLTLDGLCAAICWLGGYEEEEKAYEDDTAYEE